MSQVFTMFKIHRACAMVEGSCFEVGLKGSQKDKHSLLFFLVRHIRSPFGMVSNREKPPQNGRCPFSFPSKAGLERAAKNGHPHFPQLSKGPGNRRLNFWYLD